MCKAEPRKRGRTSESGGATPTSPWSARRARTRMNAHRRIPGTTLKWRRYGWDSGLHVLEAGKKEREVEMTTLRQCTRWAEYTLLSALCAAAAINCTSGGGGGVTQEPAPNEPAADAATPPPTDAAAPPVDATAPPIDAGPAPGTPGSTCHTDQDCNSGHCSGLWTSYPLNGFCD
jgi:hypothetical protein